MNAIQLLSVQPWVDRLGSTLLHFLWQGVLIAGVYGIARRLTGRSSSNVRYVIACAALAMMALWFGITWTALTPAGPEQSAVGMTAVKALPPTTAPHGLAGQLVAALPPAISPRYVPWVVTGWFAGVIALCLRLTAAWISAERLRVTRVRSAPAEWQHSLEQLKVRIHVTRPVRLLVSARVCAPVVVGWLRPVVLAPIGALAGLPAEQVEALLLHELAHIRRHDYLVNVLQSIVEALLFYHPAVWWISGHIRKEREICCDDLAISVSGDALTYARALVEVASARTAHLRAAMAATGGSLADRIARLLGHSRPRVGARSGPGIAAAIILVLVGFAIFAQSSARPRFEVASVKPSTTQGFSRWVRAFPDRLTADAPVQLLIQNAYGLQPFQIGGGPAWIESEKFEVEAKTVGNPGRPQLYLMLQSLLADRFQLKSHRETRELPVYALVAAKNGLRLPAPKENGCQPPAAGAANPWAGGRMDPPIPGKLSVPACGGVLISLEPSGARMQGGKVTMPELVRTLSLALGRSVIDRTGYSELFDVDVSFVADQTTPTLPAPPPDSASEFTGPSLPSALQQQLGLRLEPTKGPVEVLVIDHVERPTAN